MTPFWINVAAKAVGARMTDIVNAAIVGGSAGAVLGLGWLGAASFALLNASLCAAAIRRGSV